MNQHRHGHTASVMLIRMSTLRTKRKRKEFLNKLLKWSVFERMDVDKPLTSRELKYHEKIPDVSSACANWMDERLDGWTSVCVVSVGNNEDLCVCPNLFLASISP